MPDSKTDLPELPPYTYVPGYAPHPISDPDGHMQQRSLPENWNPKDYLQWGKRLFDNGYYWEAHEAWEHLWLQLGRTSDEARTVKGLIKLAASAVKCREANTAGAIRHATRAVELLCPGASSSLFKGCNLEAARESAKRLSDAPPSDHFAPSDQPVLLPGLRI